MAICGLRRRVEFQRLDQTSDEYGNVTAGTWAPITTVWGELRETRGRERVLAGALDAPMSGVLRVRRSTQTAAITEADRAVIDGEEWNIRGRRDPDGRRAWIEFDVERGVAQ